MKTNGQREQGDFGISVESGFTLVEVLIAVVIVVGGLLAYGMLSGSLIEKNVRSTRESIAVTLAQDKIEELRNLVLDIKDLSGAVGSNPNPVFSGSWSSSPADKLDSEGGTTGPLQYTRKWGVTAATSKGSEGLGHLFDVQVTVAWVNDGNKSVTLDTRITD